MPVSEAHALVLLAADEGEECLTACEMADYLRIDKSNVSRMCVRMEKAGTIVCVPCEHDGRIKRIQLTRKGVRLASTIEAASRKK
ncbi:MAG: MarR family transcriptional regulator, partial [Hyphomicrobium sp.]